MLNTSLLDCIKVELQDLTVCIVGNRENFKEHHDLDLDQTMSNIQLVLAVVIYYNIFKVHVPIWIPF